MAGAEPIYDSQRSGPPEWRELREVWRYRALLGQLVRRDLVTRYKRSVLGVAWTMLNPLGMMIVMSLVFSQLFNSVRGYPSYVLTGLVVWNVLSYTTLTAMNTLLWGGSLLTRVYMPSTSFALSAVGTAIVNFFLSLVPLFGVMLVLRMPIGLSALWVPLPLLLLACFSLGVALLLCSIAIFFYDVAEMYTIVLTAWMYLTPILYPDKLLLESHRAWLLHVNPMYYLLRPLRTVLYDGQWPIWSEYTPAVALAVTFLGVGWSVYTRKSQEFAYRV